MANPVCTVASLTAAAACFATLPSNQRYAAKVFYNSRELQALGGTDYTLQLGSGGQLEADAVCYMNLPLLEAQVPTAYDLVIALNNAVNVGAFLAFPPTSDLFNAAIACNKNFSPAQHAAQLLLLQCLLGSHKAYPQ